MNKALTGAVILLAIAPASFALAAAWPAFSRPYHLDRAAHFAFYAAPALLPLTLIALGLRRRTLALALVALAILGATITTLAGRPLAIGAHAPHDDRAALRVVTFNAHAGASLHDEALVAWLLEQDADLVAFIDAPRGLLTRFPQLAERYPHAIQPRRGHLWPIFLLSKQPLSAVRLADTTPETRSSYVANSTAKVTLQDERTVLFTAMHPFSPRSQQAWKRSLEIVQRDGQILRAAHQRYAEPVIVAGDFNSTPVGRSFQRFAAASGFRTAAWPLPATWPAHTHRALGVSIDHVWVSPGVDIVSRRVGPSFKSDHRPVVVDLLLPRSTDAPKPDDADDER